VTLKIKKMKKRIISTMVVCTVLLLAACKKETQYVYQVQDQVLYQNSGDKKNLKTTEQFITIAYNDLFNAAITTIELNQLNTDLQSFGDDGLIQDMIVKNLLSRSGTQVPANTVMRANVPAFVQQTYLRFYSRQPNEFEAWKMQSLIQQNADVTPQMVYYSVMTSAEYRYY
jgi:hypothetical protein